MFFSQKRFIFILYLTAKQAEEAYEQDVIAVDGFNTFEMRQSARRDTRGGKYRLV